MDFYQVVYTWVRWRLAAGGYTAAVGVTCLWERAEQEESDGENWREQEERKRNWICRPVLRTHN